MPDMPRTASGKIQKFELRERVKGLGGKTVNHTRTNAPG